MTLNYIALPFSSTARLGHSPAPEFFLGGFKKSCVWVVTHRIKNGGRIKGEGKHRRQSRTQASDVYLWVRAYRLFNFVILTRSRPEFPQIHRIFVVFLRFVARRESNIGPNSLRFPESVRFLRRFFSPPRES